MAALKDLSLHRKSLKYKLVIAFALMSVIPLLIMAYFITNFIELDVSDMFHVGLMVLFAILVAWTGYILIRQVINPIINLAIETKIIAEGQYDSRVFVNSGDELGDIASAVNSMTGKMRGYIGELQEYGKKTASLNARVHRKVLTLTNLMRLGDLISSGAGFSEVTNFAAERMAGELYGGFCAIFMRNKSGGYVAKSFFNNSGKEISTRDLESKMASVEKLFFKREYLVADSSPKKKPWQNELREKFAHMNVVIVPMKMQSNVVGAILMGNFAESVKFDPEDIDVILAFEKELVLGYQSSQVFEHVKSMDIVDTLTGLYTFAYLEDRLEDEINRAVYYQRPCSLLVLDMDDFDEYVEAQGERRSNTMVQRVAKLLNDNIPSVGKIAKFGDSEFGVLLPEMNKKESIDLAEKVREKVEELSRASGPEEALTVSIGVGENPIDGATAGDVIEKARAYAKKARAEGKNRVVGW